MSTERQNDELMRLNAFVDGELAPAERAEIAARIASDRPLARAHATLAHLKACVMEQADASATVAVRIPRRRSRGAALGMGAVAAALLLLIGGYLVAHSWRQPRDATTELVAADHLVRRAALPAVPVIPDLDAGGLKLTGVDVRPGAPAPALVATYVGPRGCRLELRIRDAAAGPGGAEGTSRRRWTVGSLSYELVAFGMPDIRFAIIAGAAERQTRLNAEPAAEPQLRQARVVAPPCLT
jgi:anti-sigma factor RsiW